MKAFVASLIVLASASALPAVPQSVETNSRSTDVLVQKADRTFVTAVTAADLRATVGGQPVAIDSVTRLDGPVSIVLLVDLSFSMLAWLPNVLDPTDRPYGRSLPLGARGIQAALDREFAKTFPPADRARVAWFAGSTMLASEGFASDRTALAAAVQDVIVRRRPSSADIFGPSPMVDAVAAAVDILAKEPGRRAVLLVSDGESSANRLSLEDAARRAASNGVPVHAMLDAPTVMEGTLNAMRYPPHFDRGRLLSKLAALTGGAFRRDDRFSEFSWGFTMPMPPFEYFFTAMHSGFRVTLSGANLTAGAPIEVTATDPKWLVSAPRWLAAEP